MIIVSLGEKLHYFSEVKLLLKNWTPAVAWMILMFSWSSDQMSSEHTSRFVGPFLRWLVPGISGETIGYVHLLIRKAAHVTEYLVLAFLLVRLFFAQLPHAKVRTIIILTLLTAVLFAVGDEFHQSFVPSRTSSPFDVLIDATGALAACGIVYVFRSREVRT